MENRNEMYGGEQRIKFRDSTISAKQAREKAELALKANIENGLVQVYGKINEACLKGLFTVDVIGNFTEAAINRLKELGYKCEIIEPPHPMDTEFAANGIRISW